MTTNTTPPTPTADDVEAAEKLLMTLLEPACHWGAAEKLFITANAIAKAREDGARLEREACAEIADQDCCYFVRDAIRARTTATGTEGSEVEG